MRASLFPALALFAMPSLALAAEPMTNPLIDYQGYQALTADVGPYRQKRLIPLAEFRKLSRADGVLLLDARSAQAYAEGHIAGAVNLPLPDFTAASLARLIGADKDRRILIYCNNNFRNDVRPIETKARPLALNIQTFINLYGYGYTNIFELGEAVDMNDRRVGWVKARPAPAAL